MRRDPEPEARLQRRVVPAALGAARHAHDLTGRNYTQALLADGVLIKAAPNVSPDALVAAAGVVGWMLGTARQDVADCMADMGAGLAIIPRDEFVTSLPEFAVLGGSSDFTGRTYDSFAIRGLGAVRGQPVSAHIGGNPAWNRGSARPERHCP